ncbi:MAG: ABC transporter permease [Chlamydiae bacterium]|nr:ABC transporter permease [Chlamydiota bacterium]MBI3266093.1 ABC transporter permease [Chlamydiota bacterium]
MKLKLDTSGLIGLLGIILLFLLALGAPFIGQHSPFKMNLVSEPQGPSIQHLFGTDPLGRDLFARTLYALRHSLFISAVASLLTLGLGAFLGMLSGYFRGVIDLGLMGLIDCMLAFPTLLLTLAVCAVLGPGNRTLLISLVISGWAGSARIIRSHVQSIRSKEFVISSLLLGASHTHVLKKHIFPHCLPLLCVLLPTLLGTNLLSECSLSFLGFGLPPPHPTLGKMVYEGARYFRLAPWWSFFPGLVIALGILSVNLLGDSLRKNLQGDTHD